MIERTLETVPWVLASDALEFENGDGTKTARYDFTPHIHESQIFQIARVRIGNPGKRRFVVKHAPQSKHYLIGDTVQLHVGSKLYLDLPIMLCDNEWYDLNNRLRVPRKQNFCVVVRLIRTSETKTPVHVFLSGALERPIQ